MFWEIGPHTASHLEALLDKEDVTLTELMDEEDVLQECKAQNRRLLLFLCQDQCMQELVRKITTEPPAGIEETKRFKYSNIACELLTSDVGVINDKLGNEDPLLETLYAFLEQPAPLNPLLASFFSKTIGNLIARKTEQVISFLRRKEGFLALVLKHIDTSAMMDVLLRLISCVEPPPLRLETLTHLAKSDADDFGCAGGTFGEHSAARGPTRGLPAVHQLGQPCGHRAGTLSAQHDGPAFGETKPRLFMVHHHSKNVHFQNSFFKYTWNNFLHLQVELCVAAILRPCAHEMRLQPGLLSQDVKAPQQEQASADVLGTHDDSAHQLLVTHLFQHCRLVQRILLAWEENDKTQSEGGMRRGYMGHLTRIANTVVHNLEKGPVHTQISNLISELPDDCRGRWETFVTETLSETNKRNTIDLVGSGNPRPSSEDDMESPFPKELTLQQAFSDYQIQQMTANFVDQFGFNDDEFTDHDDGIGATFNRIAEININIDVGQDSANTASFDACAKERIQAFDDDEEDIWEEKEFNYATQTKSRNRFGGSQAAQGQAPPGQPCERSATSDKAASSDSDEGEELKDDMDPFSSQTEAAKDSGWIADFGEVNSKAPAAGMGFAAWDSPQPAATKTEEKGWAKFTDFQPFCCSEAGPQCSSPVATDLSAKPSQNPCVWSVCGTRKAPLVASDSSSSSSSDTDEDENKTGSARAATTETLNRGDGKETIRLTVDAKNERAVFSSHAEKTAEDKGKGNEVGAESGRKNGDCPSPSQQPAAVTQEKQNSANGPA